MSIKKSPKRKTFHLRMTRAEQRMVKELGSQWGLKSWNAVVIEALEFSHKHAMVPNMSREALEILEKHFPFKPTIKAASSDAPAVSMQNEDK